MLALRNGATRPPAGLAALGAHVPSRTVTNDGLAERVDTSDESIRERTGIRERRVAAPDEAASDPGPRAAERLLAAAGRAAADVDVGVLSVPAASPDHVFPSTAALIADRIGATGAVAYDVSAGCTGFIDGLAQAAALVESGLAGTVMVIGAEALPLAAGGSRRPALGPYPREMSGIQMNGREILRFATRIMIESAARPLAALVEARDRGRLRPGDLVLLIGFGAGLTWGATVVRYEPQP